MQSFERQRLILEILEKAGRVGVAELIRKVGGSPATIRRDLDLLQDRGLLLRRHGAVAHPESLQGDTAFSLRRTRNVSGKKAIGRAAEAMVPLGASVFVDAGTTTIEAGRLLMARPDVTLVTNSIPMLSLAGAARAKVIALGGELRGPGLALVGSPSRRWLHALHIDVALIGASGLSAESGAFTTELSEASTKSDVLSRARSAILLADSSKWDVPSAVCFAPWKQFSTWVTDPGLPVASARALTRRTGVQVVRSDKIPQTPNAATK